MGGYLCLVARCEILCPVFVGRCQGKAVGIGRDSELPVERVEPESGCQFFWGAFFLTMVRRRRVDADRLCFQVGSHRFFSDGLAGVYTRWLVNDTQDAP